MDERSRDIGALKRIILYCDRIQNAKDRFGTSFEIFKEDYDYQSSCAMYILQIGESANRLSTSLKDKHNDIPWRDIIGMRNIFAHDYENIDVEKIWETLWDDIRFLHESCFKIVLEAEPDYCAESEYDERLANEEKWGIEQ
jgi:uncharacterized protein with HEPN domain